MYTYPIVALIDSNSDPNEIDEMAIDAVINSKELLEGLMYMREHHPYALTEHAIYTIFKECVSLSNNWGERYCVMKMVELYPYLLFEDLRESFEDDEVMLEWLDEMMRQRSD